MPPSAFLFSGKFCLLLFVPPRVVLPRIWLSKLSQKLIDKYVWLSSFADKRSYLCCYLTAQRGREMGFWIISPHWPQIIPPWIMLQPIVFFFSFFPFLFPWRDQPSQLVSGRPFRLIQPPKKIAISNETCFIDKSPGALPCRCRLWQQVWPLLSWKKRGRSDGFVSSTAAQPLQSFQRGDNEQVRGACQLLIPSDKHRLVYFHPKI